MSVDRQEATDDFHVLRRVREQRGWTPQQVAERLHIRAAQVEALEQARFEALPGAAFARGYLKNYARLLDLDPEPLLDLFDRRSNGAGLKPTDHVLPDSEDPLLDYRWPMLLVSLILAAAIAGIGWWLWGGEAAAPATTASMSAAGPSASAPAASSISSAAARAMRLAVPAPAATASVASVAAATGSAVVAPSQSAATAAPGLHFVFTGRCWVQVQDARGQTLLAELAEAGQTLAVDKGLPPYRVLVGKAQNVRISYDGKSIALPVNTLGVARLQVGTAPAASAAAAPVQGGNAAVAATASPARKPRRQTQNSGPATAGMDSSVAPELSSPQPKAPSHGETPSGELHGGAPASAPAAS